MENLQQKGRTAGKKSPWRTGEKSGQNTGNDFLALGLGVVLYLPIFPFQGFQGTRMDKITPKQICKMGCEFISERPDVHKIVLSIRLRSPPPGKSVKFEHVLLICTVFPHFGPFSQGGGVKPNFADKNFMHTQTFLIICQETRIAGIFRAVNNRPNFRGTNFSTDVGEISGP